MRPFRRNDRQWIFARRIKIFRAVGETANPASIRGPAARDPPLLPGPGRALDLGRPRAHLGRMPIYVYAPASGGCPTCRDGIERLQRLSDPPLERCPDCGASVERVIAAGSVVMGG